MDLEIAYVFVLDILAFLGNLTSDKITSVFNQLVLILTPRLCRKETNYLLLIFSFYVLFLLMRLTLCLLTPRLCRKQTNYLLLIFSFYVLFLLMRRTLCLQSQSKHNIFFFGKGRKRSYKVFPDFSVRV